MHAAPEGNINPTEMGCASAVRMVAALSGCEGTSAGASRQLAKRACRTQRHYSRRTGIGSTRATLLTGSALVSCALVTTIAAALQSAAWFVGLIP